MERDLLAGRTALVTGGSGGIGRALALQLAAEGAAVALGFRTRRGSAERLAAEIAVPSVAPAVLRRNRVQTLPLFVGSYLVVWILVGLAVYPAYRPHGSLIAGALTVAAGLYELTPFKHECRRRCRESVRSGFTFGLYCLARASA